MNMLVHVGLIAACLMAGNQAWAGERCRTRPAYPQPVVYVPVYPAPYGRVCAPSVYAPPTRCRPVAAAQTRVARRMVQPGYWVYQDLGCGRTRRLWQPSRVVTAPPAGSVVWVSAW